MGKQLINLHCHSHFSLMDAVMRPEDMVEKLVKRKVEAAALTDHGTLGGLYKLWKTCKSNKIKPILGCECYWVDDYAADGADIPYNYGHVTVLCQNETGWNNLKRLQEKAWETGWLKKPRITIDDLCEQNSGLIITTGCMLGIVGFSFLKTDQVLKEAGPKKIAKVIERRVSKLKEAFGDRMYAELQMLEIQEQVDLNKYLLSSADRWDMKKVIGCDTHYLSPKDNEIHDIVICSLWREEISNPDKHTYGVRKLFLHQEKDLEKYRKEHHSYITKQDFSDMVDVTNEIASRIEEFDIIPKGSPMPVIVSDPDSELDKLCKKHEKFKELMRDPVYRKRYKYEYSIITKLGFSNYFVVVDDIVQYARRNRIPYNARGSVCGSLIAYFLKVTWIDPILFDTPFERFLTEDRISLPDIDMDFAKRRRADIIKYTQDKYGKECVAHICNYTVWKPKNAIKDVAKVFGLRYSEVNEITKSIDDNISEWEEVYEYDKVVEYLRDNPDIEEYSSRLIGINKQLGIHASGVIVTPGDVTNWCPVRYSTDKSDSGVGVRCTEWDMYALEDLGILKLDFLGLNTLDIVADCIDLIIERHEVQFNDIDTLYSYILNGHLKDKKLFKEMRNGNNVGVFQLGGSKGMMGLTKDVAPKHIDEVVDIISLYRTAILQAGMHNEYVQRKRGKSFSYAHRKMSQVLDSTNGIMIYQEQVMEIAVVLAGFTRTESDHFRKGIKLKDTDKINKWKDKFIEGCGENDIDEEDALEIWSFIEKFAGYGFNKSHAASYALHAYLNMFLKFYYPHEFMCSLLSNNIDDTDKLFEYLKEAKRLGINISFPRINKSTDKFELDDDGAVLYPINAIKNIGGKALESIIQARNEAEFDSLDDFLDRVNKRSVNARVVCNLILGGAFSKFGNTRKVYNYYVENYFDEKQLKSLYCYDCKYRYPISKTQKEIENSGVVCPECGSTSITTSFKINKTKKFNPTFVKRLVYGYIFGSNKLSTYKDVLIRSGAQSLSVVPDIVDGDFILVGFEITKVKKHTDKNGNEMAFLQISDGGVNVDLVIFSNEWATLKEELAEGKCYLSKLKKNRDGLLYDRYASYIEQLQNSYTGN